MIAYSGMDIGSLKTKEDVHKKFGKPSASGTAKGQDYEDFHTRRKFSEPVRSCSLGMGFAMSFGVGELIMFPYELCLLGRRTLVGQDVRFAYDSAGNVSRFYLEGSHLVSWPKPGDAVREPEPTTGNPSAEFSKRQENEKASTLTGKTDPTPREGLPPGE